MAKKPIAKKKTTVHQDDQIPAAPSNFSYENFFKAIDKVTTGNGIEQLDNKARKAIAEGTQVEVTPYAILALTCSWKSIMHEYAVLLADCEDITKDKAREALQTAVSITGIKQKIADQKEQREFEKQQAALERKRGGRK